MNKSGKVFCIGLGKTGTTSMAVILDSLGYQHKTGPVEKGLIWRELGQLDCLWKIVDELSSFDDFPFPYLYRELYQRYPDSKFILTTRNSSEEWLASLKKHNLRNGPTTGHLLAYGCYSPEGHENRLLALYESHISDVSNFFSCNKNFMQINLSKPDSKDKLAQFLDVDHSAFIIPIANSSSSKNPQAVIDKLIKEGNVGSAIYFAKAQEKNDDLLQYIKYRIDNPKKQRFLRHALIQASPKRVLRVARYVKKKVNLYG